MSETDTMREASGIVIENADPFVGRIDLHCSAAIAAWIVTKGCTTVQHFRSRWRLERATPCHVSRSAHRAARFRTPRMAPRRLRVVDLRELLQRSARRGVEQTTAAGSARSGSAGLKRAIQAVDLLHDDERIDRLDEEYLEAAVHGA